MKMSFSTTHGSDAQRWWNTGCLILIALLSFYTMLCFIEGSDFLGMGNRSPQAMMDGTGLRPHVYRQLVPLMAKGIVAITPEAMNKAITAGLHDMLWNSSLFNGMVHLRHPHGIPPELDDSHLYAWFIIVYIEYMFLLGYAATTYLTARQLFPDRKDIHRLAAVIAIAALPPFCGKFGYIYDFPVLFFCALLTWLLVRERLLTYSIVFILATLNRETTVYMIVVYMLYGRQHLMRQEWVFYSILQAILLLTVKLGLDLYVQGAPGSLIFYGRFYERAPSLLDGYSIHTLLGFAVATGLFTYRWQDKPAILKCWLATLPLMAAAWLVFGNPEEYRVFYEIFPALTLLSAHTLATALKWQK